MSSISSKNQIYLSREKDFGSGATLNCSKLDWKSMLSESKGTLGEMKGLMSETHFEKHLVLCIISVFIFRVRGGSTPLYHLWIPRANQC